MAVDAPTPALLAEIRVAYERREVALDLLDDPPMFDLGATLDEDRDAVAERLRRALGVNLATQLEWVDARTGFNAWRSATEALGVLVPQMTSIEQREARGFSIAQRPLPVVVVKNRDPFGARSFTIIHELTHVALYQGGICDLANPGGRVEPFSNHVAGAVLVPAASLLAEDVVREHAISDVVWNDAELERLANRYGVSREVILRRLLLLGRTDEEFYRRKRRELLSGYEPGEPQSEEPPRWGPSPATIAVIRAGHYFSRLVLDKYHERAITASDVATYLGVRMKHVPRIEQVVLGRAADE